MIILSESQLGDDVHATGFTTWSSAVLLSRRLLAAPSAYFSTTAQSTESDSPRNPLRVLELGSGTGLAGIASSIALESLNAPAHVVLSDYDDVTLATLTRNLDINQTSNTSITREVRKLGWGSSELGAMSDQAGCFDVLLGADIVYEPGHPALIYTVAEHLLDARGVFHLLVPQRHTHTAELETLERLFGSSKSVPALCIIQQEDLESEDALPERRRQRPNPAQGVASHRYYRIEWR